MTSTDLILLIDCFVYVIIIQPSVATLPFSVRQKKWPNVLVLNVWFLFLVPLSNCLSTSEEIILKQLTFLVYRNGPM